MNLCRCEKGHFYDKEKYATCPHCAGPAGDDSRTVAFTEDVTTPVSQPMVGFPPTPEPMPLPAAGAEESTERFDSMDLPLPDKFADERTVPLYPSQDPPTVPLDPFSVTAPGGMDYDDDNDHTIGFFDDIFLPQSSADSENPVRPSPAPAGNRVNKVGTPCVGWLIALCGEHIGTDFRLKVGKNFIGRGNQMDVALTEDKSVSRDRHAIVVYEPKTHMYLVQPGESSSLVYKNDEVVLTPVKLEAYDVITVGDVNLLFMPLCGARFNWGDLLKKMKNEG